MKFTAPILALFLGLVVALPDPSLPLGMVQKLDARDTVVDKLVFGRSFPCSSNDPTTCCACRGGFGTCINGICSCNGGDC